MTKPKVATILDTRRIKKDLNFPVKLRVTFEREQRYFLTPYDLTEQFYTKVMFGKRLSNDEQNLKKNILDFENKAIDIINQLTVFTWQKFKNQYILNRGLKDSINDAFEINILRLRNEGRIGTSASYECAQRSLDKFYPNARFSDITYDTLRSYEKQMILLGRSITTVAIYLRALRVIINQSIEEGLLSREYYPFGKKKYEIPTSNNIKKALSLKEIASIFYYKPINKRIDIKAKDYWIFMYLCNGINVKDMCLLKYENVKNDTLVFKRAKTEHTKRKSESIRVPITDFLSTILKKWGNPQKDEKTYIFPILEAGLNPERERQLIKQFTHYINHHMKNIASELGLQNVTTYVARHSFATILQRSGKNVEFISEALGHSNIKTTQNYLGGFEDNSKREAASLLTAFDEI